MNRTIKAAHNIGPINIINSPQMWYRTAKEGRRLKSISCGCSTGATNFSNPGERNAISMLQLRAFSPLGPPIQ